MAQQVIVKRPAEQTRKEEMEQLAEADAAAQEHGHDLVKEMDEMLDEIDTVLEENCWVENYLQKGGE